MKLYITVLILFLSVVSSAKAEVFVWTDPKFGITVSFPEDWMRQAQTPDDLRLYILAPQGQDHAACRVFANEDGRFLYVPASGQHEVAQFVQDTDAAQKLLSARLGYDQVTLVGYQNIGSLSKGPSTVAVSQYTKEWRGKTYAMQSIHFAGYVNGKETVFQCEALRQSFDRWYPLFMNMVKSFDFPAQYGSHAQGHYRDFMSDGYVYLPAGYQQGRKKD